MREPRSTTTWILTPVTALLAIHGGMVLQCAGKRFVDLFRGLGLGMELASMELPRMTALALGVRPSAWLAAGIVVAAGIVAKDFVLADDARRTRANIACCVLCLVVLQLFMGAMLMAFD